jgi:hypothetical protein
MPEGGLNRIAKVNQGHLCLRETKQDSQYQPRSPMPEGGLNRIANINQGHICLREDILGFNNNYII